MDPTITASSLKEVLSNTVDNLTGDDFKRFKYLLRDQGQITWGKLEKADRVDTVELMAKVYSMGAGDIMLSILKKINCNQLAMDLGRDLKKFDITAHSRGKVDTPALSEGRPMPQQGGEAREKPRVQKAKAEEQPSQCLRQQNPKAGPKVSNLIMNAVSASKEKKGVSLFVLLKILADGGYDVEKNNARISLAVKSLVSKGTLVENKSGILKLNKQAPAKEKPPKTKNLAAQKPAKMPAAAEKSVNSAAKNKAEKSAAPKNPKAENPVAPKKAATTKKACSGVQEKKAKAEEQPSQCLRQQNQSVSNLIVNAVSASKEKKGVSLFVLLKTLADGGYDVEKNNARISLAVKSLVSKGTLVKNKSGFLKLNKQAPAKEKPPRTKKPAAKEPAEMPTATEKPPKMKMPAAKEPCGRDFFSKHKAALERRLGLLAPILSDLEECEVLNAQEREAVESEGSKSKKNRALLLMLEEKGDYAQTEFYRVLLKHDKFLVKDLERAHN